ncbi:AI-2E family transporter YdiK [Utexia brackfieldae]|uniref:AI-2E family transporter YdiK n=1 Tax=Utexia brackfieldae TaxID=3074108 RepID=UPI00370D17F9
MPQEKNTYDLLKLIINILVIGILIIVTFNVVEPFLFGFFWAVMVVIATWPLMIKIQHKFALNRFTVVCLMTLLLSLVFVIPFSIIVYSITKNSTYLIDWAKNISHNQIPELNWLSSMPVIGNELHQKWLVLINNDGSEIIKNIQPYIGTIISWIIKQVANLSVLVFHCGVMIVFSALLFYQGENVAKYILLLAARVSSNHGVYAVTLAGQAIRAVALGVVVTALAQALLGGLSLAITNIPYPGILTLIIFIFCVAQLGPLLILVPSIIWLFYNDNIISGIVLIIVAILLTTIDSVMRAALIKRGADLPFLLILCGVIGGIIGFGVMGLFVGPVVLALSYKLINAWIAEQNSDN